MDDKSILFVTSEKLEKMISMPSYTIRKLTRQGIFPAYKIGCRGYLYDPLEIRDIIKNKTCIAHSTNALFDSTDSSSPEC